MESVKKLLGLAGKLDAAGQGYEPSPLSTMLAVDSQTNYQPVEFPDKYTGSKKILVICTEQRYMEMANGKHFSTGQWKRFSP